MSEEKYWEINIGQVAPTDCTLTLKHPNGLTKEALIESDFWNCLGSLATLESLYQRISKSNAIPKLLCLAKYPVKIPVDSRADALCKVIWANFKNER